MPHVMNRREASEFPRPNVRLGKYRILSALSENFLFCKNLSGRTSESAHTAVVPSEISESGIMVLYRGILRFLIIWFLSKLPLMSCNFSLSAEGGGKICWLCVGVGGGRCIILMGWVGIWGVGCGRARCLGGFPAESGGGASERAFDLFFGGCVEVRVNFGGFDVFVAQEVFEVVDGGAAHVEVGGEAVAEGVAGSFLFDAGADEGLIEEALDGSWRDGLTGADAVEEEVVRVFVGHEDLQWVQ